ncbi:GAF sensor hybrid histidine kinase [Solidesulfovibrio carbinoliphilus subsp. oakridgensis]|uniref:Sensory/regulatory protein RpfC n=1 Tax=Solidesulfovibrio carbinoliphilus subsp. oakridgensis TaxID=694327 RepID=G7Q6G7_9BACT|nr:response regulator [Solidesulfovibrio carbinoliphilus]EHJ47580.1 GAF sensor hybrid histidine kinase [Solidesulfovibrio carbinoliphilus subsp. oakridgensis]
MEDRSSILIVDDKPENLFALKQALAPLDVRIVAATGGEEALKATLREPFALAIVDVLMPGMDGYELVRLLRGQEETKRLPVIFLTALYPDPGHAFRGYESGAVDYLGKPFSPEILLYKVKVFLDLDRSRRELLQQRNALEAMVIEQARVNERLQREVRERQLVERELRQTKEEAERLGGKQERLAQAAQALSMAKDLASMMAIVVKAARELSGAQGASFILPDGDDCFHAAEDAVEPLWKGRRFPKKNCLSGWVLDNGEPAVIQDVAGEPGALPGVCQGTFIRSLVIAPVGREAPVAALGIYWATGLAPDPEAVRLLYSLADLASVVMENLRLYDELKTRAEELGEQKAIAEKANRAKSEFLANMSHEIRTPMNGIMGMTELALLSEIPDQTRSYLQMAKSSALHLLSIINDILDLSKIEAGKLVLDCQEFDLLHALHAVCDPLAMTARKNGVALTCVIDPAVPAALLGDKGRFKQILTNIVGNAVKFTRKGQVEVGVRPADSAGGDAGRSRLLFWVRDSGIGIPAGRLEAIFESFAQATSSAHIEFGGTGLGLPISKKFVEMMGGSIWVESEEGRGSTFSFTVEFGQPERWPARPGAGDRAPAAGDGQGLRILLVEDNRVNQLLAADLLKARGHRVAIAGDGPAALGALRREPFDLVFLDIRLPGMDGEEVARQVRAGAAGDPAVPIVALTAHALKEDRERFLGAGMDDYISKPIEIEVLDLVLEKMARKLREDKSPLP